MSMIERRKRTFSVLRSILCDSDVALEVVDARDIGTTRVTRLDRMLRSKVIIAAMKADLASERVREREAANASGFTLVFVSARTHEGVEKLRKEIQQLAEKSVGGKARDARVVVFGFPNVGKSSLINIIAHRYVARTGFMPGVTRGSQWVRIGPRIMLNDTPGVVPVSAKTDELVFNTAANVEDVSDPEVIASILIRKFISAKNKSLAKHYGIPFSKDADRTLTAVAKRRGLLIKKGELNIMEAAKIVLREFQKGKFVL
ncbi:MAG: GTPase [Candidatus Micrarchaeota archaeon]